MNTLLDAKNGVLTLELPGDLVSTTTEALREEIEPLLTGASTPEGEWRLLKLDLSRARMVDSVGLNLIVRILKAVQRQNATMQILCANAAVHRTLVFTRLDKYVELVTA